MSRMESTATPALPTSPTTRAWSESLTTVCSKVKGDRQTFLARCQVTTIERIGFFRSGETSILTYCPRTSYVHCGIKVHARMEVHQPYSQGVSSLHNPSLYREVLLGFAPLLYCINLQSFFLFLFEVQQAMHREMLMTAFPSQEKEEKCGFLNMSSHPFLIL